MAATALAASTPTATLNADEHAPEKVRRLIAGRAAQENLSAVVTDTAQLLASELVTNAYRAYQRGHVQGQVAVIIRAERDELVVVVADKAPGVPLLRPAGDDRESGRGLTLVEALSHQWSWVGRSGRKVVWFSLKRDMKESEPDLSLWSDVA